MTAVTTSSTEILVMQQWSILQTDFWTVPPSISMRETLLCFVFSLDKCCVKKLSSMTTFYRFSQIVTF